MLSAMRLRHARGGSGVLVWLRCAAHDASREFRVLGAFGAFFSFFVRADSGCGVLLGLTWRSTGARL